MSNRKSVINKFLEHKSDSKVPERKIAEPFLVISY